MIAPPTPWIARKVTIHASARLPFGVSPHIADASAKTITPSDDHLAVPDGVGQPAAEREEGRQRQQVGVDRPLHARWLVRPSSLWICGAAIDTIVWSMNVIATAKIIAASTRPFERPPVAPLTVMPPAPAVDS